MSRSAAASRLLVLGITLLVAPAPRATAQGNPPGTVTTTAAVTGFHQFTGDLDGGGRLHWSSAAASAGVTWQLVPAFTAGLSIRHVAEDWRFESPGAFGGSAPWRRLYRSSVGMNTTLALSRTFLVFVSPAVEWDHEEGADTGDAAVFGAVVGAAQRFGPGLTLGAGAGISRPYYTVKTSAFLVINWKLSERLRIANAPSAGPEGGAGVELRWTPSPAWELAGGGVLRTDLYRLASSGPAKGNVGESGSMPLFARLSRTLGAVLKADLYAGAMATAHVRTRDTDGHKLVSADERGAAAIAATISFRR